MICSVSNHEVYAILWDLWNFVCQIVPTDSSALSTLLEQATNAPIKPPNADNSFLASTLVLNIMAEPGNANNQRVHINPSHQSIAIRNEHPNKQLKHVGKMIK
uniref:Uncharacterized protein n=1 Tax=Acrobeloides nanus TaxID=290746 RepID=A0A914E926_9BILA